MNPDQYNPKQWTRDHPLVKASGSATTASFGSAYSNTAPGPTHALEGNPNSSTNVLAHHRILPAKIGVDRVDSPAFIRPSIEYIPANAALGTKGRVFINTQTYWLQPQSMLIKPILGFNGETDCSETPSSKEMFDGRQYIYLKATYSTDLAFDMTRWSHMYPNTPPVNIIRRPPTELQYVLLDAQPTSQNPNLSRGFTPRTTVSYGFISVFEPLVPSPEDYSIYGFFIREKTVEEEAWDTAHLNNIWTTGRYPEGADTPIFYDNYVAQGS